LVSSFATTHPKVPDLSIVGGKKDPNASPNLHFIGLTTNSISIGIPVGFEWLLDDKFLSYMVGVYRASLTFERGIRLTDLLSHRKMKRRVINERAHAIDTAKRYSNELQFNRFIIHFPFTSNV
jgi:hypothetical protein